MKTIHDLRDAMNRALDKISPGTNWWESDGYYQGPGGLHWRPTLFVTIPAPTRKTPRPSRKVQLQIGRIVARYVAKVKTVGHTRLITTGSKEVWEIPVRLDIPSPKAAPKHD